MSPFPVSFSKFALKFRKYGLKGAFAAFARIFRRDTPIHLSMLKMAARQTAEPQHGITIIGDMTTHASLPKVLCDLYEKLQEIGVPCQCLDTKQPLDENFELLKYDHVIAMLQNPLPKKLRKFVKTSVIAFWEFDTGLLEGYPQLADGDTIIAMSDFNYAYYSRIIPRNRARKILYPLQLPATPTISPFAIREKFGIQDDAFVTFFNFDLGTRRKNPEGIIGAFAKAFNANENAVLVFKTMSSMRFPECLAALHEQATSLGLGNRFITINSYLPDEEMSALTNACDVYVSLHRGEGFGLGAAEAMYFKKPVIITDWSATTEFCNESNSIPIPFTFQPLFDIDYNYLPYDGVTRWAEPDVDAAATALRRLYDDPTLRKRLGENGRRFIEEHYSPAEFKKSISAFLAG